MVGAVFAHVLMVAPSAHGAIVPMAGAVCTRGGSADGWRLFWHRGAQEVRERTRAEEAAELRAGVPTWEVEVRAHPCQCTVHEECRE